MRSPSVGITSSPVIDPYTSTLYAVDDLRSGSSAMYRGRRRLLARRGHRR